MSGVIDRNQTGASPDVPGPTDPARPALPGASAPGSPRPGGPAPGVPAPGGTAASGTSGRAAPERPPVVRPNTAPVVVKVPPPFSVRLAQFFWILGIAVGGFTIVYFFVIRETQLPLIADVMRGVVEGRSDETYESAADIVFWVFFATMVVVTLAQITLLVSFMARRPHIRWWQFATWGLQVALLVLSAELVALGERGQALRPLLIVWCAVVLLALGCSILPKAIDWSARQHDVRAGPVPPAGADF